MSENKLANVESSSSLSREATRKNDQYISPAVDIFETDDGLTLMADMPGLDEKSLDISIDQDVLTIKGDAPAGAGNFQYREFAMAGYWRQFILSDGLPSINGVKGRKWYGFQPSYFLPCNTTKRSELLK
ncbi:MAG: Hsp20/alpha crystallin family protein [Desulfuromonadales bacterium]